MRLHLKDGVSYRKIASDLEIASSKLADVLDEYRSRVAPLAEKWWEWKQQPKVDPQMLPENKVDDTAEGPEKETQYESIQNEEVDDTQPADGYEFDDEDDESIFDDHEDEAEDGNSAGAA
jgi:hypothetical protein